MSDDIEIPTVEPDDIIETSDEENSVAYTIAVATAGAAAGVGIWYGTRKLAHKLEDYVNQKAMEKMLKKDATPDQKE